jgi:hypothetical protein
VLIEMGYERDARWAEPYLVSRRAAAA